MARGTAMLFYTHTHTCTHAHTRRYKSLHPTDITSRPESREEGEDGDEGVNEAAQPTRGRPVCLLRIIQNLIRVRPPSVCQRAALSLHSLVHSLLTRPSFLV